MTTTLFGSSKSDMSLMRRIEENKRVSLIVMGTISPRSKEDIESKLRKVFKVLLSWDEPSRKQVIVSDGVAIHVVFHPVFKKASLSTLTAFSDRFKKLRLKVNRVFIDSQEIGTIDIPLKKRRGSLRGTPRGPQLSVDELIDVVSNHRRFREKGEWHVRKGDLLGLRMLMQLAHDWSQGVHSSVKVEKDAARKYFDHVKIHLSRRDSRSKRSLSGRIKKTSKISSKVHSEKGGKRRVVLFAEGMNIGVMFIVKNRSNGYRLNNQDGSWAGYAPSIKEAAQMAEDSVRSSLSKASEGRLKAFNKMIAKRNGLSGSSKSILRTKEHKNSRWEERVVTTPHGIRMVNEGGFYRAELLHLDRTWLMDNNMKSLSGKSSNRSADKIAARELALFAVEDAALNTRILETIAMKKVNKQYNKGLTLVFISSLLRDSAEEYMKTHGSPGDKWWQVFDNPTISVAANQYLGMIESQIPKFMRAYKRRNGLTKWRTNLSGKKETYSAARTRVLADLKSMGWKVKASLKTPRAVHPSGKWSLYFKPQAVWYGVKSPRISTHLDIRGRTGADAAAEGESAHEFILGHDSEF